MTSTSSSAKKNDLLVQQTRLHFPRFEQAKVEITPIEKGGSDRRFYRVRMSPDHTLILVKYNLERAENRVYVQVAEFLAEHGIRAPKIYFHDETEGLIWIEDLGETDLWSYRNETWGVRRALYESALDQIAQLHLLPATVVDTIRGDLPAEFDAPLYLWEQQYFFENCLDRHFGIDSEMLAELSTLTILRDIAERLGAMARVLVHRDFQSQNIVIRNGHAHLIDFQGMRPGLWQYDVASLLYDPYVSLLPSERDELFTFYCELRERNEAQRATDQEILRLCAMQRLMQALGAYGYLGHVRGNKAFLEHIPSALKSLRGVVGEIGGAERLHTALQRLS
ncbi:MAG TPA: phosphotransferase [Chthoniobacterales bacterium]|nr:phosphotransferase [Chthoniobacterales bacterium]